MLLTDGCVGRWVCVGGGWVWVGVCGWCVGRWVTEVDSVTQQANKLQENHVILSHHNVHRLEDATNR